MAERLCRVCKGWHDLSEPWPRACVIVAPDRRSPLATPMVVADGIEVQSMVDGRMYTSKRALRQSYRENGFVEVGDQKQTAAPRPKSDRAAIRHSMRKAFSQAGIPV